MAEIETHPVQKSRNNRQARCPKVVTMRAYEAYCDFWNSQEALVSGDCRGGFGTGELIALLYAMTFPKNEWRTRFDEALTGMENL